MNKEFDEELIDGLSREEWLERSDRVRDLAWRNAQETVAGMGLEMRLTLPSEISGLYLGSQKQYALRLDRLQDEFGDLLPSLLAYTQWVKWVSCWDGAHWYKQAIEQGVILDNDYTRSLCTGTDYARKDGWSYAVFNKLMDLNHHSDLQEMAARFGLEERPSDNAVLGALGLHWLWLASDSKLAQAEVFEFLHEAGEAKALSHGLCMWDDGMEYSLEVMESDPNSKAALSARRLLAKTAAEARHAPNQAVREQVVARYMDEKIQYSSKDAAAIAFTKHFPFEFSTIRGWLKGA